jgi:hypothetical protein
VSACLLLITGTVSAQLNVPKFQFGAGIGTMVYMGDLTPTSTGSYKTLKPAVNLFASKLFSPSFALRANLAVGKLKGDDAKYDHPDYRQQRNFNFTSPVAELSAIAEWNVLGRNYTSRGFAPYVFGGIGYSFLHIRRDWSHLNAEYFAAATPLLTGLVVDAQHVLPKGLLVAPVGFSQAVNPTKGDHYSIYSIGVVYRIGKKNMLDCPVMR